MNEEESLLDRMAPRPVPSELRERVLNAVVRELALTPKAPQRTRWERLIGCLVAAAVVLGFVFNWWAIYSTERRLAELAGPRPVPSQVSEIVEIVESVTGEEAREWVQPRLMQAWGSSHTRSDRPIPNFSQLMHDLEFNRDLLSTGKAPTREEIQKIPDKNDDRAVFDRRGPAHHECNIAFDSRSSTGQENWGHPGSRGSRLFHATHTDRGRS